MVKKETLKIHCLSQPLLHTEWDSLMGDKYAHALPFTVEFVDQWEEAEIIAWDGIITVKNAYHMEKIIAALKAGKKLLLQGEARTAYRDNPLAKLVDLEGLAYEELPGWCVPPEDILQILQKLKHV